MITIKTQHAIETMTKAGKLLAQIFVDLESYIKPGLSTLAVDTWIADRLSYDNLVSQSKGYGTYKHVSCISLNDEVVHGVPRADRIIQDGDLVKVDVCAAWNGYCADMARCFFVGQVSDEAKKLAAVAQSSLDKGIEKALVGNHLTDISAAIQSEVERYSYGVVREFAGHGIGKRMHEEPEILNYGKPGRGPVLRAGMAFAIEPMITQGNYAIRVMSDGWTAQTVDKSLAAHVEDTVIITEHGPQIITRL